MGLSKSATLLSWVYALTFWVLVRWVTERAKEDLLDGQRE